jgi:hypothetical protein
MNKQRIRERSEACRWRRKKESEDAVTRKSELVEKRNQRSREQPSENVAARKSEIVVQRFQRKREAERERRRAL